MKKSSRYLILSYGFFLGWLLSFLYNGPALAVVFSSGRINTGKLAIAYILTPAIIFFYLGFYNFKEKYKSYFMKYSVAVCILGTILTILVRNTNSHLLVYLLAGIMGIFSVLFITGWGCYFVDFLNLKNMYKHMAYVICIGYIIFHINKVLLHYGQNKIIISFLFVCLIGAYVSTQKLTAINHRSHRFNVTLSNDLLVMMCFLMFLLNVGGGLVHALVAPLAEQSIGNIHLLDIVVYVIIGVSIYNTKKKMPTDVSITVSMVMIACGYMFLTFFIQSPIPAYTLIIVGYAILDIALWTLVGEMGYIFGQPIKIFVFIMASNLMAVFTGNLFGMLLSDSTEHVYISIAVTAISAILAFVFLPFINKLMQTGLKEMEEIKATREALDGVVTEEKAEEMLTQKELEIYKLMLLGLKNKEIAVQSNISTNTLKGHARNIYKKFNVRNKKELIKKCK